MPHLFALSTLNSKHWIVFPQFIVAIVADTNAVKLITALGKSFRVEGTLENALAWMIDCGEQAVRAHNSYIINLRYAAMLEDNKPFLAPDVMKIMTEDSLELIKKISFSRSRFQDLLNDAVDLTKPLPPKPEPTVPVCSICKQKMDEKADSASGNGSI